MKAFEKLYKKLLGPRIKPRRDGRARKFYGISLLSTFVCVILVLFLMFTLLIPELVSSVTSWRARFLYIGPPPPSADLLPYYALFSPLSQEFPGLPSSGGVQNFLHRLHFLLRSSIIQGKD